MAGKKLYNFSVLIDEKTLQEKATKWTENHEIDGLTTNGVLIMHPRGDFCGGSATCGPWRETSVGGAVFSLRESRSAQQKVNRKDFSLEMKRRDDEVVRVIVNETPVRNTR